MRQLYETSGFCLKCDPRGCEVGEEAVIEFGQSALRPSSGKIILESRKINDILKK